MEGSTASVRAMHMRCCWPVSYTHLDVYKRQAIDGRVILNSGSLQLQDIEIHDGGTGGSTILNRGELIVIGQTGIYNQ